MSSAALSPRYPPLGVVLEQLLHLLVGVAAVALDHRVNQVPALHAGLAVHLEDGAVGQLLLAGAQRADEVAEPLGQHGDGAVDKVDAGGAPGRLAVDDGAFGDIVGHVGDVNAHLPQAAVKAADGERVVKVLGVAGVDGAGEHVAVVLAHGQVAGGDVGADLRGGVLHVLRIPVRQAVLGQDGVHLRVVLARPAEHVDHLAHHVLVVGVGPLGDLHHGLVAGLAALQSALGHDDVAGHQVVGRDEHGDVAVNAQPAHKLVARALEHGGDHRLLDVVAPARQAGHLHAVAVEGRHGVALGHEHGLAAVVGHKGVLAVRLAPERALLELCLGVQPVLALLHLREIVVPGQLLQGVDGEHLRRVGHQLEMLEYLLETVGLRGMTLEEALQQLGHLLLVHPLSAFLMSHIYIM